MAAQGDLGTIMVVEDNDDIRAMYADILGELGYGVISAADGAEALAILDERDIRPSLLIVDLEMPVLRGEGLVECFRARHETADVPLLVVTVSPERTRNSEATLGLPVLRKPFSLETFTAMVAELARPASVGASSRPPAL
ncbi:MAG TPA: response regulator [Candidatus Limnocylindria bacterium]